jgi:hypothetical protein
MVSLIVSEFVELKCDFFVSVGECFNDALGGGGDAGDVVGAETVEESDGEGHLAHEVDGGLLSVGEGKDFVEKLVGECGNICLVTRGVDTGEREVDDRAELPHSGSELYVVPQSGWVVGKVD